MRFRKTQRCLEEVNNSHLFLKIFGENSILGETETKMRNKKFGENFILGKKFLK